MIVLDCTLRDGGYQNNWKFELNLANDYLKVMEKVKISAIEIGFRSPLNKSVGKFANVTDDFIRDNLYIPDIEYFGVMVNTSEITDGLISKLFNYSDRSLINIVRVATHFRDISLAECICKDLKHFGYTVCINLMQAADKSFDEIKTVSEKIESWNSVNVLYLADSLGNMNHDDVNYAYKAIREGWNGLVGFHGHNNKGKALDNTLEAIDIGVDWVDGTILGIGRGAGNTETEYLLMEISKRGFGEFFELDSIYRLVLNQFFSLKKKYEWGPSLPYYLSAEYGMHPTYIQTLLSSNYSSDEVLESISYLQHKKSNSFNLKLLEESLK